MSETTAHDPTRQGDSGVWDQTARISFGFLYVVIAVLTLGWITSNVHQIPADSRAVVLRFGAVTREAGPGLLIAWPAPIEEVVLVPSADQQLALHVKRFEGGTTYSTASTTDTASRTSNLLSRSSMSYAVSYSPRENAGFLLTGDSSVVVLQAVAYYQISDAVMYVTAKDYLEPSLERLVIASAVNLSAKRDLDSILVARPELAMEESARTGREQLRGQLVDAVNARLRSLAEAGAGLGVVVTRLDLIASIPMGAKDAFDYVLIATQDAERAVAQARTTAAMTIQQANQESDRILSDSQARAEERVTEARARTAAVTALAKQANEEGDQIVIKRIYAERIKALLPKAQRVETVGPDNGLNLIIPGAQSQ